MTVFWKPRGTVPAPICVAALACILAGGRARAQPLEAPPPQPPGTPAQLATDLYGDPLPRYALARLGRLSAIPNDAEGHTLGIYQVAFAPDGKLVATRGGDGTVRVWETARGKLEARLEASKPLAFSSDGSLLLTGGVETGLRLWNTSTWKNPRELDCKSPELAVFLPEDRSVLVLDGEVPTVISLSNGAVVHRYASWRFYIVLQLGADGEQVAVGHSLSDPVVAFGQLSKNQTEKLSGNREFPRSVALSTDGRLLAVGERSGDIHVWRLGISRESSVLRGHAATVQGLALSPDGWFLASASADKTVRLWEVATGKPVAVLTGHRQHVAAVAFSPDGQRLVSGSLDRTGLIWDVPAATMGDAPMAEELDDEQWQALWESLSGDDAQAAYQALGRLAAQGEKAAVFLQKQMDIPLRLSQKEQVERWLAELDSPQFMVRERATQALIAARDVAGPLLRDALKSTLSAEVRHRIRRILAFPSAPTMLLADELRLRRTVRLLARIGGGKSQEILERLAEQSLSPLVVQDARRALAALNAAGRK